MTKTREEFPERYYEEFPFLCRHLLDMILGERCVFSADFLARGDRFDTLSAEKMWRMTSCPEMTTFQDVAHAVFTGNVDEAEEIWRSQPTTEIQSFSFTTNVSRTKYRVNKRKDGVRSPTNPEVQTASLNFEEIRRRLDDLKLMASGWCRL